jgi:hypothetical protein
MIAVRSTILDCQEMNHRMAMKKGTDRTRLSTFFFQYCLEASIPNHHHCFYYSVSKTSNIFLHFLWLILFSF